MLILTAPAWPALYTHGGYVRHETVSFKELNGTHVMTLPRDCVTHERLAFACYRPAMSERSPRRRPKRTNKRKSVGNTIIGWTEGLRRNPLAFFAVGLGLGIVVGVALAVHHGKAPSNQVASTSIATAPPKLAPQEQVSMTR